MNNKINETRTALFQAWFDEFQSSAEKSGVSIGHQSMLLMEHAFNAALDAVEIELPASRECDDGYPSDDWLECNAHNSGIAKCRAAIESTNLGLKIK